MSDVIVADEQKQYFDYLVAKGRDPQHKKRFVKRRIKRQFSHGLRNGTNGYPLTWEGDDIVTPFKRRTKLKGNGRVEIGDWVKTVHNKSSRKASRKKAQWMLGEDV